MDYRYILAIIAIIGALVLLYWGFARFIRNKSFKQDIVSTIDLDALVMALGGQENITHVTSSPSKVTLTISNHDIVKLDKIKELGASGIVQGKETISCIFGKQSPLIEQDLHNKYRL